tara:strand:- start:1456 stop:2475 length:1020 start_codon:yes stop_codon:yes gene_type:complete
MELSNESQTAIATIQKHREANALVYVSEADLQTQKMFKPVVSVITGLTPDDFHQVDHGRLQPKRHVVDEIKEKAGIDFVFGEVQNLNDHTWKGRAQGRKRLPDGTWMLSSICEYEFNAEIKAEKDFLKSPQKYPSAAAKRKHLLGYLDNGNTRANTGARLRVIREINHMPTAFKPQQLQRAIVVARVEVNSDALLEEPGMERAAIGHAFGQSESSVEAVFGPDQVGERNVTPPTNGELPAPEEETKQVTFTAEDVKDPPAPESTVDIAPPDKDAAMEAVRNKIMNYVNDETHKLPPEVSLIAVEAVKNPVASKEGLEVIQASIEARRDRMTQGAGDGGS